MVSFPSWAIASTATCIHFSSVVTAEILPSLTRKAPERRVATHNSPAASDRICCTWPWPKFGSDVTLEWNETNPVKANQSIWRSKPQIALLILCDGGDAVSRQTLIQLPVLHQEIAPLHDSVANLLRPDPWWPAHRAQQAEQQKMEESEVQREVSLDHTILEEAINKSACSQGDSAPPVGSVGVILAFEISSEP